MKRVVLVGATSHVAKALVGWNLVRRRWDLRLVARRPEASEAFLGEQGHPKAYPCLPLTALDELDDFDAIVNCVGFGTPQKVRSAGAELFSVPEDIDNRILTLVAKEPHRKYLNFSSGAVYGTGMEHPIGHGFTAEMAVSPLTETEFYRITKLYQEAKHRARPDLSIVDLRLFSFFSRHIDPSGGYLMTDILDCLRTGTPLKTGPQEIYRDFIAPEDLYELADRAIEGPSLNGAYDTFSAGPISKSDLLRSLTREFHLEILTDAVAPVSPTGTKQYYYSQDKTATEALGYQPRWTSWEGIKAELLALGLSPLSDQGA